MMNITVGSRVIVHYAGSNDGEAGVVKEIDPERTVFQYGVKLEGVEPLQWFSLSELEEVSDA